ncbi:MAG: WYL domain-containing protein [Saprospiraceae bacterium]|nr:WYL domain-containing protein [Saprospiraceae bacterium]
MPTNRNALIRYKTIDNCLQNRQRKWSLENLIDKVSNALYEYEGIDSGISKRTIQTDLQIMRSDKLGYNAPIIVKERKYYTYEDPNYSITNIPLTNQDLSHLTEAVEFLKQFQGFSHFKALGGMVQKLEDHIFSTKQKKHSVIDFDVNLNLRGLDYLDQIYRAIIKKQVLKVHYQAFGSQKKSSVKFHPYLLKEFNNRWYMLGRKESNTSITNYALDRIQKIKVLPDTQYIKNDLFKPDIYFKDVIGVTINDSMSLEDIVFKIDKKNAQYIITKPIHHSQNQIGEDNNMIIFQLKMKINIELERLFLSFGQEIEVLSPHHLRNRLAKNLEVASKNYLK